jgi:hypothetical protein
VAVAEFGGAERGKYLGIGGELRRAECLETLYDGILFPRGKGRDDSKKSNGKYRQRQLATIDIHCFLHGFVIGAVLQPRALLSSNCFDRSAARRAD